MAYTVDGTVAGACPEGFDRRLPQVQLFVRIIKYKGGTYTLSNGSDHFHVDFMNGWEDGKLQEIIDNCQPSGDSEFGYNPPCDCDQFLTPNREVSGQVCDTDVRRLFLDEPTDVVSELPRGTCQGPGLIPKSWTTDPPLQCTPIGGGPGDEDEEDGGDEIDADELLEISREMVGFLSVPPRKLRRRKKARLIRYVGSTRDSVDGTLEVLSEKYDLDRYLEPFEIHWEEANLGAMTRWKKRRILKWIRTGVTIVDTLLRNYLDDVSDGSLGRADEAIRKYLMSSN